MTPRPGEKKNDGNIRAAARGAYIIFCTGEKN